MPNASNSVARKSKLAASFRNRKRSERCSYPGLRGIKSLNPKGQNRTTGPEVVKTKGGGRNATEFQSAIGCPSGTALGRTNYHSGDYRHRFDLLNRRVCAK